MEFFFLVHGTWQLSIAHSEMAKHCYYIAWWTYFNYYRLNFVGPNYHMLWYMSFFQHVKCRIQTCLVWRMDWKFLTNIISELNIYGEILLLWQFFILFFISLVIYVYVPELEIVNLVILLQVQINKYCLASSALYLYLDTDYTINIICADITL